MTFLLLITILLGIAHTINWLLTKGIIFVIFQLFNINWYGKFWIVYLLIIMLGGIFRGVFSCKIKGD